MMTKCGEIRTDTVYCAQVAQHTPHQCPSIWLMTPDNVFAYTLVRRHYSGERLKTIQMKGVICVTVLISAAAVVVVCIYIKTLKNRSPKR